MGESLGLIIRGARDWWQSLFRRRLGWTARFPLMALTGLATNEVSHIPPRGRPVGYVIWFVLVLSELSACGALGVSDWLIFLGDPGNLRLPWLMAYNL